MNINNAPRRELAGMLLAYLFVGLIVLPTSTHAATNLIPNSGFETSSSGTSPDNWIKGRWGTNTAVFSYPVTSGDGSKAVSIAISAYTSGDAKWAFAQVPVIAGHTYEYTDTYTSDTSTYITLQYTMNDGSSTYPDIAQPAASSAWKTETYRFTAPSNAKTVTVYHLINRVGTLKIDNVSLTDVTATTPPPPSSGNVISNPSMETVDSNGQPTNWAKGRWGTNTANFVFPTPGYAGSNAARIDMSSYSTGDAKWYFTKVPVTPGTIYQFSDYYKSNVTTYVTVQYTKTDGTTEYKDLGAPSAASGWTQFKGGFTVPAGVTSLTIFHVIKSIGSLEIDNYSLVPTGSTVPPTDPTKFDKGYVSINFDDGWLDAYQNTLPILTNYGFKSDQFIISNRLGGSFPAYINSSQVMDLQNKGQVIGAHTINHVDLTTLSSTDADQEIVGSRNDLLNIGISPVKIFAYPFGAYNSTVQQLVKNAGFIAARSSDGGYNDKNTDMYALRRQPMVNTTTFADVKSYIDTAMANKTWVILLFHEVSTNGDQYAVTPALFAQVMDYLKQQNITPITIEQGVALMKQ